MAKLTLTANEILLCKMKSVCDGWLHYVLVAEET